MSEYEQKLLNHFMNPRNVGTIENPDGFGQSQNPVNGYLTDITIRLRNDRIEDMKFKTFGCVVTIASASALTHTLIGKTISEIIDRNNPFEFLLEIIKKEMGDAPEKNWHCPPSAIQALLLAFADFYRKKNNETRLKKIEKILDEVKCYFEVELKKYDQHEI